MDIGGETRSGDAGEAGRGGERCFRLDGEWTEIGSQVCMGRKFMEGEEALQ